MQYKSRHVSMVPAFVVFVCMMRGVSEGYLRPKSAGISPHCSVSHFMIRLVYVCVWSHDSARRTSSRILALRALGVTAVLACRFRTHACAVFESENMVTSPRPAFSSMASAWTMARNSPMLFVPPSSGPT